MSAVALHVIKAMKFHMTKMTIYPLSFNKTNCDLLIYEPQDTHKVFQNIKLKTFKTEIWVKFLSLYHTFRIGFTPSRRLNTSKSYFLHMLLGLRKGLPKKQVVKYVFCIPYLTVQMFWC